MAGVAYHDATITQVSKVDHVSYNERYQSGSYGGGLDEEGEIIPITPVFSDTTHRSNAKIDGKAKSTSNVYVNGKSVVFKTCQVQEVWVADPTPYAHYSGGSISAINPSSSGSGNGSVTAGSASTFIGGNGVAAIGSVVTTHLGTLSAITQGSTNVFVNG